MALKPKDMLGIPRAWRLPLQDAGWWLRQGHHWHKPNPMPESVQDRCTKAHEYVFCSLSRRAISMMRRRWRNWYLWMVRRRRSRRNGTVGDHILQGQSAACIDQIGSILYQGQLATGDPSGPSPPDQRLTLTSPTMPAALARNHILAGCLPSVRRVRCAVGQVVERGEKSRQNGNTENSAITTE